MNARSQRPDVPRRGPGRDYALLFGNNLIFFTGVNLVSAVTILPVFVSHLTESAVIVGMVPAMVQLSFSLPQIAGPSIFANKQIKKNWLATTNAIGALAFALFGLLVLAAGDTNPTLLLVAFFPALIMLHGSAGIGATGWVDIMGKIIAPRIRGRFFGASTATGGLLGAAGLAVASGLLGDDAFPRGYGTLIAVAGLMICGGSLLFLPLREPLSPDPDDSDRLFWRTMRKIPRVFIEDRGFLYYAGARVVVAWAIAATAFITVLGARDLGATGADVARLTMVFLLSQVTGSLSGGWLADWFGVRFLPVLGSLATVAAIALAFSATDLTLIYAAVALAGLVSMLIIADITIVLEVAPAAKRPQYMAGLNLILGPLALPAPLLLGRLVDVAGFHTMFGAAIVVALAGLLAVLGFAFGPGRKMALRAPAQTGPG
jgi:hypothetical protein